MTAMLAPLNSHQEEALRNIGVGSAEPLDPVQVCHLVQLELIDWGSRGWRLTAVDRQRYECLVVDLQQRSAV